eukprot:11159082-Lingulodinium_polyedra.AAC.1
MLEPHHRTLASMTHAFCSSDINVLRLFCLGGVSCSGDNEWLSRFLRVGVDGVLSSCVAVAGDGDRGCEVVAPEAEWERGWWSVPSSEV